MNVTISKREREILKLIAHGFSSKQIAQKLYISLKTVETHRRNMLTKYNALNACNLVYLAAKDRLI